MATMAILLGPRKRKARRNGGRSEVGRVGPKISESSSSLSSSSPPHVQSVCFRGKSIENDMIEWFHFTMAGSESNKKKERRRRCQRGQVNLVFHHNHRHKGEGEHSRTLSPIQIQPPDCSSDASLAALGSIIYCIGGCRFQNTRQVHYFDVNRPKEGWKEASSMINPRSEAKVVALHGKLYVFGGCSPDCGLRFLSQVGLMMMMGVRVNGQLYLHPLLFPLLILLMVIVAYLLWLVKLPTRLWWYYRALMLLMSMMLRIIPG
ncbi:hypothetical protein HYC85_013252 [Camellia sinensis]|uniref:Uncharacterized protein n=1 Tax=Camellia sinensis TaxID=4442 RepID=A0A7J7H459_CAMSI|nr:hypothetical protein HYC85_013252 [Camellia sinensis]